ncbi:MAG: efflux RND transporter periplasmic adaptor subunit [Treponema sp.]|jgi:multidrug efflux pump subunit AcrA (membrane-fusion protein)|nr:efflux RND transporter periplasmic adaptor subunit [Treponema sp.]
MLNKQKLGTALILLAVLTGCNKKENPSTGGVGPAPLERPVFAVNTTMSVAGQISDYIALSGDVIAGTSVDAYSDAAGKITRVYVRIGNRVSRGDPIAAVDPSRPGMNYIESIVRAPIGGTIVALPAQVGMTISQSVPLARIGGTGLETRVYVAERFISKVALNQSCDVILDAYPGEVFRGSVREISPTVDPTSRTMEVRINVSNTESRLKAGMFAKVRIITETKENIVKIPASAVITRFGETYLFTLDTDPEDPAFQVARKTVITQGILVDGILEVREGLEPDAEIVVKGQTLLNDGVRVQVIEKVQPIE